MLSLEQEDGHLSAGDRVVMTVVPAAAARGDPSTEDLFDVGVEEIRLRDIEEVGEPAGGEACGQRRSDLHGRGWIADDDVVESPG